MSAKYKGSAKRKAGSSEKGKGHFRSIPSAPLIPRNKGTDDEASNSEFEEEIKFPLDVKRQLKSSYFRVIPNWEETCDRIDGLLNDPSGSSSTFPSVISFMTIPFGFQLIRSLLINRPNFKLAAYNSMHDVFLGIDGHFITLWQGQEKIAHFEEDFDIADILFVDKYRVHVGVTHDMTMKVQCI